MVIGENEDDFERNLQVMIDIFTGFLPVVDKE